MTVDQGHVDIAGAGLEHASGHCSRPVRRDRTGSAHQDRCRKLPEETNLGVADHEDATMLSMEVSAPHPDLGRCLTDPGEPKLLGSDHAVLKPADRADAEITHADGGKQWPSIDQPPWSPSAHIP